MSNTQIRATPSSQRTPEESQWYSKRQLYEWTRGQFFKRFELDRAAPDVMDALWADGWRHFGAHFFRDIYNVEGRRLVRVIPLRIDLSKYSLSRDHRRTWRRNHGLTIAFKPMKPSQKHHDLFEKHKVRFEQNQPIDLFQFISPNGTVTPCPSLMCEVWDKDELRAVSFMDIGSTSTSSIYAMFDPEYSQLSLGNYTLLCECEKAKSMGKRYLYTGYAHVTPSYYEYKKRFKGTEFYDWKGVWRPLEELESVSFPEHRFEREDIPEELLISNS